MLKQMAHKMMTIDSDAMEIDDSTQTNKKRKFPDGIGEGVSLLQNGLRLITSGLSFWQQNQLDYFDSVAFISDPLSHDLSSHATILSAAHANPLLFGSGSSTSICSTH
ncbi:hypothetical protein Tco_0303626, partial [Tanacetum coccineum]